MDQHEDEPESLAVSVRHEKSRPAKGGGKDDLMLSDDDVRRIAEAVAERLRYETTALPPAVLTLPMVCQLVGFKRTKLMRLVSEGRFPAPREGGGRGNPALWSRKSVEAWINRA